MTTLSHWEKNRRQAQRDPASMGQITPRQEWQSGMAELTTKLHKK